MRILITGAAALAVLVPPATAETRYDRKIDQAAADIVAAKLGDLRGSLAYDVRPLEAEPLDLRPTGSIGADPVIIAPSVQPMPVIAAQDVPAGLAPAVEKRVVRIVF